MDTEAFHYTRQTLGYPDPFCATPAPPAAPAPHGDVEYSGGRFRLGAEPGDAFVFDNEKWAHPVEVAPFRMARAPVTNAEFAAFVEEGGYQRREWWSSQGWVWRTKAQAERPLYWRREGKGGLRMHLDELLSLQT